MASTAVVTGASGFVALELVKQLLEKGYNVRGTVRSVANKEKVASLTRLGEALPGTLELYEADLLKDGSFDKVVDGADYVFHTASPFITKFDDPQTDLVDPALKGTRNVLNSVAKHKDTVKRVVVTSSFAAVTKHKGGPSKPPRYTENDWNDESNLSNDPYSYGKTLAETAAWKIAEKEKIDLVVINPTFVLGPILSDRADGVSITTIASVLAGLEARIYPCVNDVRDIGRAHILAVENPSAKGRYIVSQPDTTSPKFVSDTLQRRFPQYKVTQLKDEPSTPAIDNAKALEHLGLGQLRDPEESIVDMAITLIQKGLAKPQPA